MIVKNADDDERISIALMIKRHDVKCVQFSPSQWATLYEYVDDINIAARAVDIGDSGIKLRLHLGAAYYASITSGYRCVDIRKFYKPHRATQAEIRPTKRGLALRFDEWAHLCSLMQSLRNNHPSLKLAHPCHLNHLDQPTFFTCLECCPFGYTV